MPKKKCGIEYQPQELQGGAKQFLKLNGAVRGGTDAGTRGPAVFFFNGLNEEPADEPDFILDQTPLSICPLVTEN